MTRRVMYTILESKLLLSILDCETDLSIVRVDDGICGAQERLAQDNRYPYISTYFQNQKVYGYIGLSHSYIDVFKNSLGVAE